MRAGGQSIRVLSKVPAVLFIDRKLFPRTAEVTYLDTAAEGLPPLTARDAMSQYLDAKTSGSTGRPLLYEAEREATAEAARLLGTEPANVTFLAHASDALNILANSIDWKAGDEIVLTDLEFPSNVVVWLRLQKEGVKVRVVPSKGGLIPFEKMLEAITPKTRLVSVSYVSYVTGTRVEYVTELAVAAHANGAVFCLDATQALGRLPVPLDGVDFLVASSYKWLLGIHGLGLVYIAPAFAARLRPASAGWYSIQDMFAPDRLDRFSHKEGAAGLQPGMPNFGSLFVLRESLRYLMSIGVGEIDAALQPVIVRLRKGIEELGFDLLTPACGDSASGIVSFQAANGEGTAAALLREGIVVWGGDGRVRASVHLYNDSADVDKLLSALSRIGPSGARGSLR